MNMSMITHLIRGLAVIAVLGIASCAPSAEREMQKDLPDVIPTAYMIFYEKASDEAIGGDALLKEVAAAMLLSDNVKATISGFRSAYEGRKSMDSLRVQRVVAYLVGRGVDPARITAKPGGLAARVDQGDDSASRRRVEIFLSPIADQAQP